MAKGDLSEGAQGASPAIRSNRVVILSAQEFANPVIAYILEQTGWHDADRVIVEDIVRDERIARRLPVNNGLWQQYGVYLAAQRYELALVTGWRGMGYFLLQSDPNAVQILPYRSLLLDKLLGAVVSEHDLVGIELEEYVLAHHTDRFLAFDGGIIATLEHKVSTAHVAQGFLAQDDPSKTLLGCHFLFFPHPRMVESLSAPERGTRIDAEAYLVWYRDGIIPEVLRDIPEGTPLILVDEGYDFLNLGARLVEQGDVERAMLAIDQRKPVVRDPKVDIPGIRSRAYLGALLEACGAGRFIGYGDPAAFATSYPANGAAGQVRLSVIVVYHNRPKYFAELLAAFAAQTIQDFELVVVDNGSREDIVVEGSYGFPLKILRNMNSYPGLARNIGAGLAQGEYLVFFDDDNLPKPEFVAEMLAAGQRDMYDLTLCFRDLFVGEGDDVVSRGFQLSAPHLKYASSFRNYIGDNVFVMKRAVFETLQYTDFFEVGREDIEFLQYVRDSGLRVGILPKDLYLYRLSNADKIGHKHLTHRTREQSNLDYGSYRKYFRSSSSVADRKLRQIVDSRLVEGPRRARSRSLWQRFRGLAARSGVLRAIYYKVFK